MIIRCACCEPYHKITTKYIRIHEWDGLTQKTNSMAFETVSDVRRDQSLKCAMASCCCGCCIDDFANLIFFGSDATNKNGVTLINVAKSSSVHQATSVHLREIHKQFRQTGKNLGQRLNDIKLNHR